MSSPNSQASTLSNTSEPGYTYSTSGAQLLESNGIYLIDTMMDTKAWSDTDGLTAREAQRHNASTQKLAQKMRKRKIQTMAHIYDSMKPFLESIIEDCPELVQKNKCIFPHDAVPTIESLKNTVHRLPVPKPAISIGHHREIFSAVQIELQDGIIVNPVGEPCDLRRVSQPVTGLFWPFFVVEISDQSMSAARQASAITSATCNNSIRLLQGAADLNQNKPHYFPDHAVRDGKPTFSLSVHGKTALLSIHSDDKGAPFVAVPVASYNLEVENDVASLAGRIRSIFMWAQSSRLDSITSDLDQLRRKVYGDSCHGPSGNDSRDFDPNSVRNTKEQPAKNPRRMKTALRAGLPWWMNKS